MKKASDPQRASDTEAARDAEQAFMTIEIKILASVDDIETSGPKHDSGSQPQDTRIERTAHSDPGGCGRDAQAEAEHQMGKGGEAFAEGIKKQDGES